MPMPLLHWVSGSGSRVSDAAFRSKSFGPSKFDASKKGKTQPGLKGVNLPFSPPHLNPFNPPISKRRDWRSRRLWTRKHALRSALRIESEKETTKPYPRVSQRIYRSQGENTGPANNYKQQQKN